MHCTCPLFGGKADIHKCPLIQPKADGADAIWAAHCCKQLAGPSTARALLDLFRRQVQQLLHGLNRNAARSQLGTHIVDGVVHNFDPHVVT